MKFETQALVDRLPGLAAVVGAEGARRGDGDVDALGVRGIENDGVQAHAARAGLPVGAGAVAAQAGELLPGFAAVGGAEQRRVFHARVDRVGVGERGLKMPHALELPRMLRAVVPLVRGQRLAGLRGGVVDKLVAGFRAATSAAASSAGTRAGCQVLPPSSERWISWPNQPLVCEA